MSFFQSLNKFSRENRLFDVMNNFRFHVLDVSFQTPAVFNLSAGFTAVTAPELNIEHKQIIQGSSPYPSHVPYQASVPAVTLTRGVRLLNSDFYDWAIRTVNGEGSFRRNLMLIQYMDSALAEFGSDITIPFVPINDLFGRIPGRAWILYECVPSRYKAGTDFDSLGDQMSIAELEVQPKYFEEFNLGI